MPRTFMTDDALVELADNLSILWERFVAEPKGCPLSFGGFMTWLMREREKLDEKVSE